MKNTKVLHDHVNLHKLELKSHTLMREHCREKLPWGAKLTQKQTQTKKKKEENL